MSQLETRPAAAARRRTITANADEHLLLFGEVATSDLGQGPVADPELDLDRLGLAGRVEYPDAPTGDACPGRALPSAGACAARTAATRTLTAAARALALLRFDPGRTEAEGGVGHPEGVLLRIGHDPDVRGHRGQQGLVVVGSADHHVVRHDVLQHLRRLPHLHN